MEALGGVISGAAFGGGVKDQYKDFENPQNAGHMFIAMRPELFIGPEAYRGTHERSCDPGQSLPLAEGFTEILMPGEGEQRRAERGRREGLEFSAGDIAMLREEAASVGAASPV